VPILAIRLSSCLATALLRVPSTCQTSRRAELQDQLSRLIVAGDTGQDWVGHLDVDAHTSTPFPPALGLPRLRPSIGSSLMDWDSQAVLNLGRNLVNAALPSP